MNGETEALHQEAQSALNVVVLKVAEDDALSLVVRVGVTAAALWLQVKLWV